MLLENIGVKEIKTEVLVIGSGAAGAKAAIEAQDEGADVLVVTKGLVGKSGNTVMAGRGVQAPLALMDPRDNPDIFLEDVVKGGGLLNKKRGMSWYKRNVNPLLKLRLLKLNGEWDSYWKQRRKELTKYAA